MIAVKTINNFSCWYKKRSMEVDNKQSQIIWMLTSFGGFAANLTMGFVPMMHSHRSKYTESTSWIQCVIYKVKIILIKKQTLCARKQWNHGYKTVQEAGLPVVKQQRIS